MSEPFIAPDYPEPAEAAASPVQEPTAMLQGFQKQLDDYLATEMAKIQRDVAEMLAKAGIGAGAGASPAMPFRASPGPSGATHGAT